MHAEWGHVRFTSKNISSDCTQGQKPVGLVDGAVRSMSSVRHDVLAMGCDAQLYFMDPSQRYLLMQRVTVHRHRVICCI